MPQNLYITNEKKCLQIIVLTIIIITNINTNVEYYHLNYHLKHNLVTACIQTQLQKTIFQPDPESFDELKSCDKK